MKKLSLFAMMAFLGIFMGILSSCNDDDKDDGRSFIDDKAGTFQVVNPKTGVRLSSDNKISLTDGDTVKFSFQPKEEYQKDGLVFKISCSELTKVDGSPDLFVAKKGQLKVGDNAITVRATLDGEKGTTQIGNDTYTLSATATYTITLAEATPQSTILFEAPYTVWGTERSSVKSTMSSRGYTLAKESTNASDNYYLGYNGKYKEMASMYSFDKDMKLNEVDVMVQTSAATVTEVGDYLTSELGYIFVTSSNGSYGYVSRDQKTLVLVSAQTISEQKLVIITFIDPNKVVDEELFEVPYTVWGTARNTVKSTMNSRGYTLADESTNATDNYYLAYEGKHKELLSMYFFNTDIELYQAGIMLLQSVASVSEVGEYLTLGLDYVYLTSSDGTYSYVSQDYSTVVFVFTQSVNNQTLTMVTFADVSSLYSSSKKYSKSQLKTMAQKFTTKQPITQMKLAVQKAFQNKIQRISNKTAYSLWVMK